MIKHNMINFEGTFKTFDAPLAPGNYVMPFEFKLLENLPGTVGHYDFADKK